MESPQTGAAGSSWIGLPTCPSIRTYRFAVARSAGEMEQSAALALDARRWDNGQAPGRR